jgi:hypothetical protein
MEDFMKLDDSASVLYAIRRAKTTKNIIEQVNPRNSLLAWPAGKLMLVQPPKSE